MSARGHSSLLWGILLESGLAPLQVILEGDRAVSALLPFMQVLIHPEHTEPQPSLLWPGLADLEFEVMVEVLLPYCLLEVAEARRLLFAERPFGKPLCWFRWTLPWVGGVT